MSVGVLVRGQFFWGARLPVSGSSVPESVGHMPAPRKKTKGDWQSLALAGASGTGMIAFV
jgi:hypothetical protein